LCRFAAERGWSNAQVALAWLLCAHPHVIPIPGTRHIRYLEQNLRALDCSLSAVALAQPDPLFAPDQVTGQRYPQAGMLGIE
jgi:aryl-alcohol dehydrogenase-like predicted oxidoreductase